MSLDFHPMSSPTQTRKKLHTPPELWYQLHLRCPNSFHDDAVLLPSDGRGPATKRPPVSGWTRWQGPAVGWRFWLISVRFILVGFFGTLGCSLNLRWCGLITKEFFRVISHCYISYVHITREMRNPWQKKNMPVTTSIMTFLEVYMYSFQKINYNCLHHLHVFGCFWLFPTLYSFFLGVSNTSPHYRHHVMLRLGEF